MRLFRESVHTRTHSHTHASELIQPPVSTFLSSAFAINRVLACSHVRSFDRNSSNHARLSIRGKLRNGVVGTARPRNAPNLSSLINFYYFIRIKCDPHECRNTYDDMFAFCVCAFNHFDCACEHQCVCSRASRISGARVRICIHLDGPKWLWLLET